MKAKILKFIAAAAFVFSAIYFINIWVVSYFKQDVINLDEIQLIQLNEPQDGDSIAIIKTNLGDIKAVLYPEYAPETVANFVQLAESGYYDNTYIFHVEPTVYMVGGSPKTDGSLPDNYNQADETIPVEKSQNLWPFKGAWCCYKMTGEKTFWEEFSGKQVEYGGSRFIVLNSIDFTDEIKEDLLATDSNTILSDAFIQNGGVPNFSQQMTVFAQTYEGFDIIDIITGQEVDEESKQPLQDIIIETVEISTYDADVS